MSKLEKLKALAEVFKEEATDRPTDPQLSTITVLAEHVIAAIEEARGRTPPNIRMELSNGSVFNPATVQDVKVYAPYTIGDEDRKARLVVTCQPGGPLGPQTLNYHDIKYDTLEDAEAEAEEVRKVIREVFGKTGSYILSSIRKKKVAEPSQDASVV